MDTDKTLIYKGKTKDVYRYDNFQPRTDEQPGETSGTKYDILKMVFSDRITSGNGEKESVVEDKGRLNCQISGLLFDYLSSYDILTQKVPTDTLGIPPLKDDEMVVYHLKIIPLEVIVRNVAAGSFCKRYGVKQGTILDNPMVEFCVKDDDLGDPFISIDNIISLGYTTREVVIKLKYISLRINELLKDIINRPIFDNDGGILQLVDYKLEFGFRVDEGENIDTEQIYLGDEISPDSMRLWREIPSPEISDKGIYFKKISLDKDIFRKTPTNQFKNEDLISAYNTVYAHLKIHLKKYNVREEHFENSPIVIISGSKSDDHIVKKCTSVLDIFQVPYRTVICSAHRNPELLDEIIKETKKYARVYIAIAGMASILGGVIASKIDVPVISVPVACHPLMGIDALLCSVQSPSGVPVLTVGIDNGANGGYAALKIILS